MRAAVPDDATLLHLLAAETFPLACPPDALPESIAAFIAEHLSEAAFAGYLADPARDVLLAEVAGEAAGYVMVVHGHPTDPEVAAVTASPTSELSKCYVRPGFHGAGVAQVLVESAVAAVAARGSSSIWLGVNQQNAKANRFYEKSGFVRVGTKKFLVGARYEDDFVRERVL